MELNIKDISITDFLREGLELGYKELDEYNKRCLARGYKATEPNSDWAYNNAYSKAYMDYTKNNITKELNELLEKTDYKTLKYNSEKTDYIIKALNLTNLNHNEAKIIDWVVYYGNDREREEKENKEQLEREEYVKSRGFIKIDNKQQELDHKKVVGLFKLSITGLLGSINKWTEKEGTLIYSEYNKCLMLMPKRHTKTGYIIQNYAYVRVL